MYSKLKLVFNIMLVVFISLLDCKGASAQKEDSKNNLFSLWPLGLSGGTPSPSRSASTETTSSATSETPTFRIGGVVSGLVNSGLSLQNNGSDNLNISSNGSFTFTTAIKSGTSYQVAILTQPTEQDCILGNSTGTANTDITNITIVCTNTGKVATPNANPMAGTYNSDQAISLSTTSSGATIYYTLDGSTPTTASLQYTGTPISVTGHGSTATIKAFATKPEKIDSDVLTANFTINYDTVATPSFTVTTGTYNTDQNIGINISTPGATIHYTVDGSTPTTSSPQYTGTLISVSGHGTSKTIKAIGVKPGLLSSAVATGSYTIAYDTVANPTFSITPGTYNSDQLVGITTNTVGATIYYTTNGTTPTNASTEYTGTAIPVSANGTSLTIKAIAIKPGLLNSAVTIGTFIISYGTVASPSFNLAPGTYTSDQSITISTTTVGATIYYTTDGNTPTTSSSQYVGTPISVSGVGTKTIKALAVKSGMLDSSVASASYTITYPTIGGTVSGLLSGTVVLQNNGGDNLSITANGSFTFPTPVAPESSYNVTILSQSSTITCKLGNATGSANQNITTITLDCILLGAQWARTTLTGGGLQQFLGVAIKEGSIYAVGEIGGNQTHDFGNSVTITQSFTGANAVIVKYNNNGTPQWAKTIYSTISTASRFDSVAIGSDGSIYAAGMIGSNTTYNLGNSVTVSSSGSSSGSCILLVKYDSNGNAQWAKSLVAGNSSSFKSVAVGSDGSVYAAGYLNTLTTYDFGNSVTLTPSFNGSTVFVAKYNSDGVTQWAKIASGGNSTSIFSSVGVGSDNSAYLAGFIQGTTSFNFGNGVTAMANDASFSKAILVKYNSSGVAQWAKMGASSGSSRFNSVAIGSDDSIYCFGAPGGTIDFGNSVSLASSSGGVLLVKYDSNGNAQWAKTSVSTQPGEFLSGVISGNYIYVGGVVNRTVANDFGNSVVATGGYNGNNTLIVKYDLNGNAIWARTTSSGTKNSRFSSIAVDSDEFVYGAGLIQDGGTINFGNSVTATGLFATNRNAVLVKYK